MADPERRHMADARDPEGPAYGAAAAVKDRFRQLDKDRNGMLDLDELCELMNGDGSKMTRQQCEKLMGAIDRDGSGMISFAEFVDFIFGIGSFEGSSEDRVVRDGKVALLGDVGDASRLQGNLFAKTVSEVKAFRVQGAPEEHVMNGQYDKLSGDWIVAASASVTREEASSTVNGKPAYQLVGGGAVPLTRHLFFGQTKKGALKGWFIAAVLPKEGKPVEEYLMFNPSPNAKTPDRCCATWQTQDGKRPKAVFVEPATQHVHIDQYELEAAELLDEELWDCCTDEDDGLDEESADEAKSDEDFDWDCEWAPERGEFFDESSGSEDLDTPGDAGTGDAGTGGADARSDSCTAVASTGSNSDVGRRERLRRRSSTASQRSSAEFKVAPGFRVIRKRSSREEAAPKLKKGTSLPERSASREWRKSRTNSAPLEKEEAVEDYSQYEDGNFVDHGFPPSKKALGKASVPIDGWMRLSKMHETPCLFRRVVPDNVIPNADAGNYWFLSACAATAEYPAWIQSMFGRTTQLSPKGKYIVRLYHPGRREFIRIKIDDYVPVKNRAPAFAGITGDGEIWPALVEKAFAKFARSYANTEWGQNLYGLLYICGGGHSNCWARVRGPQARASSWKRSHTVWNGRTACTIDRERAEGILMDGEARDVEQLWGMLRRYMELCYPVACEVSTSSKAGKFGLLDDRSYALLGAREIPVEDGRVLRMIFLRNPFGVGEWTGRWSDSDPLWEKVDGARGALDMQEDDDGTFWISYVDFLRYFDRINVVKKSMPVQGCNKIKLVGLKRGLGLLVDT